MGSSSSASSNRDLTSASGSKSERITQPERTVSFETKHTKVAEMANTDPNLYLDAKVKRQHPEMKAILDSFKSVTEKLPRMQEKAYFNDVITLLKEKILHHFVEKIKQGQSELLELMGNYLARINFVTVVVNYYQFLMDEMGLEAITQSYIDSVITTGATFNRDKQNDPRDDGKKVLILIRQILWNFSDSSPIFGEEIANSKMFYYLVKDLQKMSKQISSIQKEDFPFKSALSIIGNCARSDIPLSYFTVDMGSGIQVEIVECLLPFLQKSKVELVKLQTLLVLAHIVNEDQFHYLTADDNLITFLLDMVDKALNDGMRRYEGFSVEELLSGLSGMARNDDILKRITELDRPFSVLKQILLDDNEAEQTEACHLLHHMAFEGKSKEKIKSDKKLWEKLNKLRDSKNKDLSDGAKLAYFTINSFKKDEKGERRPTEGPPVCDQDKRHIMISYCQKNKETVYKIYDHLLNDKFKVWIDKEDIRGSLYQAMAKAVEDASVIIICYSEEYVSSRNCRSEAEYAETLNKKKIYVRLKYKYRPKGWLGIMLGSQIYHDFSDSKTFLDKYKNFLRDLKAILEILKRTGNGTDEAPSKPASTEQTKTEKKIKEEKQPTKLKPNNSTEVILHTWTKSDMGEWLKANNLEKFAGLKNLTGAQLTFLYEIFRRAPEFFYKCLEEKLGLRSLEDLMRFSDAVKRLRQEYPDIDTVLTI